MIYIEGNTKYYISGGPGHYAVKATGNNRIVMRFDSLEKARFWLSENG